MCPEHSALGFLQIHLLDKLINVGILFLQCNIKKKILIKDFSLYLLQLISCHISKGIGK